LSISGALWNQQGQALSPIRDLGFRVKAVLVTIYMPEAKFAVTYYKTVPLIPDATIKQSDEPGENPLDLADGNMDAPIEI
jgi:hypothetical protein